VYCSFWEYISIRFRTEQPALSNTIRVQIVFPFFCSSQRRWPPGTGLSRFVFWAFKGPNYRRKKTYRDFS